ncbi:hypothetical protein OAJ57_00975 [Alphaproteobacteria bacterium]|nr:hypothetical protein [Alphaproteobacteria bacterium]
MKYQDKMISRIGTPPLTGLDGATRLTCVPMIRGDGAIVTDKNQGPIVPDARRSTVRHILTRCF